MQKGKHLNLIFKSCLMDAFTVEVDRTYVEPFIGGFEGKLPQFDMKNAEFYLFKIPPKQESEDVHIKRLEALKILRSKEILKFASFLERNRALPIIKIKTDRASYVIKPTHSQVSEKLFEDSQKNIRFETYTSELASQLGIGPKFYEVNYFNPRMLLMAEECISEDNGWNAMYRYAGKLDLKVFPGILGRIVGRLHKSQRWRTWDNRECQGHLWYKDRVLLHLFCNPKTDTFRLVDFGNAELIYPERFKTDKTAKSRLLWEVEKVATELIDYAFPFERGIRHKNVGKYKNVLDTFCNAYSEETGTYFRLACLKWIKKSQS